MTKFFNYGQFGVSRDPVFLHNTISDKFKTEFKKLVSTHYGVDPIPQSAEFIDGVYHF